MKLVLLDRDLVDTRHCGIMYCAGMECEVPTLALLAPRTVPLETTFAVQGEVLSDEEVVEVWPDAGRRLVLEPQATPDAHTCRYTFRGPGYHYSIASNSITICCRLRSGRVIKQRFPLVPHREPSFTDVFTAPFALPRSVCILAPGPNGVAHYRRIPDDYCVMALNKGVLIPDVRIDIWVLNQLTPECLQWYPQADRAFRGTRLYRRSAAISMPPSDARGYYFTVLSAPFDKLSPDRDLPLDGDGAIRGGATVAGLALQLAYNFGARQVALCGVDMSGDGYWDGSRNPKPTHGEQWLHVPTLNRLISHLGREGMDVYSLSPTKLDVDVR